MLSENPESPETVHFTLFRYRNTTCHLAVMPVQLNTGWKLIRDLEECEFIPDSGKLLQ
jgi:hypothetical protein